MWPRPRTLASSTGSTPLSVGFPADSSPSLAKGHSLGQRTARFHANGKEYGSLELFAEVEVLCVGKPLASPVHVPKLQHSVLSWEDKY